MSSIPVPAIEHASRGLVAARRRWFNYDEQSALVLMLPVLVVLAVVAVFPILYSFYTSFFELNLARPLRRPFVGVDNYLRMLQEPRIQIATPRDRRCRRVNGRARARPDRRRRADRALSRDWRHPEHVVG